MASGINKTILFKWSNNNTLITYVRFYARWTHRHPTKIYLPHEYDEVEKQNQSSVQKRQTSLERTSNEKDQNIDIAHQSVNFKIKQIKTPRPLTTSSHKTHKESTTNNMFETVIDEAGNLIYTKMENHDQRVGVILAEIKSKNEKTKKNLILLEGKRLIRDALQSNCQLKYILFSRTSDVDFVKPFLPKIGAKLYKMPYRNIQMWSDLTTTPGIMGIFKIPDVESYESKQSLPITVICDNIREPGNLGSILRICAGVGCRKVILTKGCVDLWDSKVLRSSVGAHFKLQIHKNIDLEKLEQQIEENASVFIADNKVVNDKSDEHCNSMTEILNAMPVLPYYGVEFRKDDHVVLIIGGETLGISRCSYEIAAKLKGLRLNIPLSNNLESLNVGSAFGIIAFEIKRQLARL